MNNYELLFIISPQVEETAQTAIIENIVKIITENQGTIINQDIWGKKRLAYPIKKHNEGYYVLLIYTAPSALQAVLNTHLLTTPEVIRYMITKPPLKKLREEKQASISTEDKVVEEELEVEPLLAKEEIDKEAESEVPDKTEPTLVDSDEAEEIIAATENYYQQETETKEPVTEVESQEEVIVATEEATPTLVDASDYEESEEENEEVEVKRAAEEAALDIKNDNDNDNGEAQAEIAPTKE